ncbi:FAD-dependent monooxygenase [Polyangium aurulentum]|uniref:FAD-dependent monooxygenase n=1 Tax=Polyangium aurulentum TaxID=2567896 RepID=UPI0010AE3F5E|nr:FAD-dependent monooxygenase [Polyangium aurulentum]UQA56883.1 FAD-dependent monooxygenase [Polyangium aurulentum]
MTREQVDVAVVGGGPVGLMLASELALAGVKVAVFERRKERVPQSRALSVHPRTLEVLAIRGLEPRFLARGKPLPTGHYAALDTRLDFSALDTTFPFSLFIPQTLTEALLEERARELGVALHRGHRVRGLAQDAEGVDLEGEREDGTFGVRARYVVGADGARSVVRTLAGIAFPGTDVTTTQMLGDVVLGEPPPQPVLSRTRLSGGAMLVPLGDGVHHRVVVISPGRQHVPLSEPVTLEELSGAVRDVLGTDFGMHSPLWLSRFGNETRHAGTYREGRVLLAGDAAHIHMPAGGQGLNVGLQDAMNLGWKLAGVLRGFAPSSLLDSYHHERHPVGARLLQNTLSQTALMTHFSPAGLALRDTFSALLAQPEVNRALAEQIAAFDVTYPAPALPAPAGFEVEPAVSGRRLSDQPLRCEGGATRSLYSLLHQGKWLLLRRPSTARFELPAPWRDWTTEVTAELSREVPGLGAWSSLLVRPDGHLGYVSH